MEEVNTRPFHDSRAPEIIFVSLRVASCRFVVFKNAALNAVEKQNARDVNPARSLILGIGGRAEIISDSPGLASASDSGADAGCRGLAESRGCRA